MISLPQVSQPSSLLWDDNLQQAAQDLRDECRRYSSAIRRKILELLEYDALELHSQGDPSGCAVILIYLSDLYREFNQVGPAQRCCAKAEQLFRSFPGAESIHNHAVALYSLGLGYYLLGDEKESQRNYTKAQTRFAEARSLWIKLGNSQRRKQCDTVMQEIKRLKDLVNQTKSQGWPSDREGVFVPILSHIGAGQSVVNEGGVIGFLTLDNEIAEQVSFALIVRGDSMVEAGILDGDLILIEKKETQPPDGKIVAVVLDHVGAEATLKRFFYEQNHIRLEPANSSHPLVIIQLAPLDETALRDRYSKSHPGRSLDIHSGVQYHIAGWAKALIRKQIR